MEFMEGGSLRELINNRGPLSQQQAVAMSLDAARGLQVAHDNGVVHRDVKPANLMLTRSGRCKLVDFGLVSAATADNPLRDDDKQVIGTPAYISPEVVREQGATAAADVYSLGMTLYELLTGEVAYQGATVFDTMRKHVQDPTPDILESLPDCSPKVAELVTAMLAKNPEDRAAISAVIAMLQSQLVEFSAAGQVAGNLTRRDADNDKSLPWKRYWPAAVVALLLSSAAIWLAVNRLVKENALKTDPAAGAESEAAIEEARAPAAGDQPDKPPSKTNSIGMQFQRIPQGQ